MTKEQTIYASAISVKSLLKLIVENDNKGLRDEMACIATEELDKVLNAVSNSNDEITLKFIPVTNGKLAV